MKKKVINSPIRWAGSKKKILNEMLNLFDKEAEFYIEPFLGSGVVLINLLNNIEKFKFKKIYVNDINSNIINFYRLLKNDSELFISKIEEIVNEYNNTKYKEEYYYKIRNRYNEINAKMDVKSIYFYFLMKAGFNGVYRENRNGKFNVPYGRKERIIVDNENLKFISEKLKNVEFYNYDYIKFFEVLKKRKILNKSFVYFDPPYIPEDKIVNQKQELYTKDIFEHEEFVDFIDKSEINKFIISMSDSTNADKVYGKYYKNEVNEIIRTINPKKLIKSTEVVYSNFEIKKDEYKDIT